jgi:DNA topoisomerase VI subunit A
MLLRILPLVKKTNLSMHSILMSEKICPQLKPGKKAEQKAFAGNGLDYVMDMYLPERLKEMGIV